MAKRLRALFLNHSIISPLCLLWVRAPLWPHVRQALLLAVSGVFSRGSSPHLHVLIGPSQNAASHLELFYLPMSHKKDARLTTNQTQSSQSKRSPDNIS